MEFRFVAPELRRLDRLRCEAAALPYFAEERPFRGARGLLDWRLHGRLARLRSQGRLTGAAGEGLLLPARRRTSFDKLFLFGLGSREGFDEVAARLFNGQRGKLGVVQGAFIHHTVDGQRQLAGNLRQGHVRQRSVASSAICQQRVGILYRGFATLYGNVHYAASVKCFRLSRVVRGRHKTSPSPAKI